MPPFLNAAVWLVSGAKLATTGILAAGASASSAATEQQKSSSSNRLSTGAVAGLVLGGLAVLGLCVWLQQLGSLYLHYTSDERLRSFALKTSDENGC